MREPVVNLPVPAVDGVDHLREGEHRRVAGRQDGEDGYDDEDELEHLDVLREEIHAGVGDAGHMQVVGEEVGCVRDKSDEAPSI